MTLTILLIIAIIAGFYMAWNIGANDVANAMGTAVGSGALTLRRAILLAAIFEFSGAFLAGTNVANTIQGGIVPPEAFATKVPAPQDLPATQQGTTQPATAATLAQLDPGLKAFGIGMLAALLASSLWLNVATFLGQPVSTTHAIIGAIIGFAVVYPEVGFMEVRWSAMGRIAASWVISPLAGGVLAFFVYKAVVRWVLRSRHQVLMARNAVAVGLGTVIFLISSSIILNPMPGLAKLKLFQYLNEHWYMGILAAATLALIAFTAVRIKMGSGRTRQEYVRLHQRYPVIESWFGRLQIVTACYMAFAHGANDVANAIGPMSACINVFNGTLTDISLRMPMENWVLAFGGLGIVVGLATYGYKVIWAVGRKITEVTPTRGFSAEVGTATTVLVCSKMGLPISTTFVLVGAVMGVGIARGFGSIDLKVIRQIFTSWLITIPISAILSAVIFLILRAIV